MPLILYHIPLGSSIHPEHVDDFHNSSYMGIKNSWKTHLINAVKKRLMICLIMTLTLKGNRLLVSVNAAVFAADIDGDGRMDRECFSL